MTNQTIPVAAYGRDHVESEFAGIDTVTGVRVVSPGQSNCPDCLEEIRVSSPDAVLPHWVGSDGRLR